jgi:hypothetical protein
MTPYIKKIKKVNIFDKKRSIVAHFGQYYTKSIICMNSNRIPIFRKILERLYCDWENLFHKLTVCIEGMTSLHWKPLFGSENLVDI